MDHRYERTRVACDPRAMRGHRTRGSLPPCGQERSGCGVNHSQPTSQKHMRAMTGGMQRRVLTFTKAAFPSDPPMMYPAIRWAMWKLHPAAMSMVVAEVQPKRRRA